MNAPLPAVVLAMGPVGSPSPALFRLREEEYALPLTLSFMGPSKEQDGRSGPTLGMGLFSQWFCC